MIWRTKDYGTVRGFISAEAVNRALVQFKGARANVEILHVSMPKENKM